MSYFESAVFFLVWMHKVFLGLQIFDNFPIYLNILESSVQDNENLGCDSPVVQIWNMTLEDELESTLGAYVVSMFSIHALKHIDYMLLFWFLWVQMEGGFGQTLFEFCVGSAGYNVSQKFVESALHILYQY